jgi:anti-anti-sigma regulatory factor
VFSLFGRRDKVDSRRPRDGFVARVPDSTLRGPNTPASVETQRELARRTAEKIDQIESEMIAAPAVTARAAPPTQPMPARRPAMPAAAPAQAGQTAVLPAARELPALEFNTSMVLGDAGGGAGGIQVNASSLPPELEEAAILFANGQPQPAAATLKAAIARASLDGVVQQAWLMLLDVLQACGNKAEFEAVARDFAARFEKSPPGWQGTAVDEPVVAKRNPATAVVAFPAQLDDAVRRHVELVERAGANRRLVTADFGGVTGVAAAGALPVVRLVGDFEKAGRECIVLGAAQLFQAARAAIEPGRRDDDDGCWQLALLALRLLGEKQAFDDLSIDFCVTYEVSPPSWEPLAPCIRTAAAAPVPAPVADARPCAPAGSAVEGNAFAMRGDIVGRMADELRLMRAFAQDRADVVIDCRGLRRLDFVAAGELLNEVVGFCTTGKTVLFVEPSAIVDALLVVMGIHELADIRRRKI